MAYQIKTPKQPPSWMDPRNYDYIDSLSERRPTELLKELQIRRILYHLAIRNSEELKQNEHWVSIISTGRRSLKKRFRAKIMTRYAKEKGELPPPSSKPKRKYKRKNNYPKLELSINTIASIPLLTLEVQHLIREHKKKYKIDRSERSFKPSHISKIKKNKLIPFIDLLIWKRIGGQSTPSELFAEMFLPPDKTANFVDKRVRTLADTILSPGYLEEFDLSIRKNAKK